MAFGRFNGGQGFTKKALKAVNEKASPEQIKRLIAHGLGEFNLVVLSYEQASYLLKELKRNKQETLNKISMLRVKTL